LTRYVFPSPQITNLYGESDEGKHWTTQSGAVIEEPATTSLLQIRSSRESNEALTSRRSSTLGHSRSTLTKTIRHTCLH